MVTDENGQFIKEPILPDAAYLIPNEQLRVQPFFAKGPDDAALFNEFTGSAHALKPEVRKRLLAEALPARTMATGRQAIPIFNTADEIANFDMQINYKNGWPTERLASGDQRWRHNDFIKISYPFIYKLYDEFINRGGLK